MSMIKLFGMSKNNESTCILALFTEDTAGNSIGRERITRPIEQRNSINITRFFSLDLSVNSCK